MQSDEHELRRLEQCLQQLSPSEPSGDLMARVSSAFELPVDAAAPAENSATRPAAPSPASWSQPFAAAAAVAIIAGIIAVIGLNRPEDRAGDGVSGQAEPVTIDQPHPVGFVPAHAQNTYQGSNYEDIIFTEDRRPVRVVRHQFLDSYTWVNPEDGSRVEIQFPVERIRYLPVPTD